MDTCLQIIFHNYKYAVRKFPVRELGEAQLERLAIPRQKFKILHTPIASSSCVHSLISPLFLKFALHILVSGYRLI